MRGSLGEVELSSLDTTTEVVKSLSSARLSASGWGWQSAVVFKGGGACMCQRMLAYV